MNKHDERELKCVLTEEETLKYSRELAKKTQVKKIKKEIAMKKGKYVIVRTYSAGVFAGELVSRSGREVVMANARRLWFWSGAASLSQLAMEGTKDPAKCKFPCPVERIVLLEAIEIIDVTPAAQKSIEEVSVWKK